MKKTDLPHLPTFKPEAYGVGLILISALCFSAMGLLVSTARGHFRADTLVLYRSVIQILCLLPWWREYFPAGFDVGNKMRIHFLRGTLGIASMYFVYNALQHLPLGLVNQLTMTSVVWATLFAALFFHERVSRRQLLFTAITVLGVSVGLWSSDLQNGAWEWNAEGVVSALVCGVFMGGALTVLRKMRQGMGSREIVFFFGWCGLLLALPTQMLYPEIPQAASEWVHIVALGLFATAGQLFMSAGFRYLSTMAATVAKLPEMVFNVLLGLLFLGEHPPWVFYAGTVLVVVGLAGLAGARAKAIRRL